MYVSDYLYEVPNHLIAQYPSAKRQDARLLVLTRKTGHIEHRFFKDLLLYLKEGDLLIINDSKVMPVRLKGIDKNGKDRELLLKERLGDNRYAILFKGRYSGAVSFSDALKGEIKSGSEIVFIYDGDLDGKLQELGAMPLPPYIKRQPEEQDKIRYQTVYAKERGSIAAPTAGLHFTEDLLNAIRQKGVILKTVTLHVGTGSFRPIKSDIIQSHKMDSECFEITLDTIKTIKEVKDSGAMVFLVGTTSVRTLESYFSGNYVAFPSSKEKIKGKTDFFIYPGYKFNVPDALITNFHQPASTPLLLASAFAGKEFLFKAYREAIEHSYRFFSYGDAMLVL